MRWIGDVTICTDDPSNCGGSSAFAALDREPQAEGATQHVAGLPYCDESFDDPTLPLDARRRVDGDAER